MSSTQTVLDDAPAEKAPALAPPVQADLPQRTVPFWKLTGPGAVLVGLSIGAGEIVIWPRIGAQFGPSMLWAAVLGVFLQLWINIEVGRWTIATGQSAYAGFARVWKGFALAFILFNFFGWFLPAWARVSGSALKALIFHPTHPSPDWLWTGITFALVAGVLFGPKRVYATVEKLVGALVILVTLGLVVIAVWVGTRADVWLMFKGLINVGYIEPGFSGKELFIAMVFAGAGGTANLFYCFYLRDKGIGMGARVPMLLNPFRQRVEASARAGFVFSETPENRRRFRDWFRFVLLDQIMFFWLLNTFTIMLFIFGAVVVLWPKGIVPESGSLIWDEAMILAQIMGTPGRYLFLLIGLATLFSTQLTLVDGVSRSMADMCHGAWKLGSRIAEPKWYAGWAVFMIVFGVVITFVLEMFAVTDLGFLFNAAYIGGFAMAVYVPLTLWMNLRHLPRSARPGWLNIAMMLIASGVYVGFATVCLISEVF